MEDEESGSTSSTPVSAYIEATTTTWTDLLFAGFHATTRVKLNGTESFETDVHRFGVDGKWIPSPVGSRRTDNWSYPVPLRTALADRQIKGGQMIADFVRD